MKSCEMFCGFHREAMGMPVHDSDEGSHEESFLSLIDEKVMIQSRNMLGMRQPALAGLCSMFSL